MLVQSFFPDSFSQSEHPVTLKIYFGLQVTRYETGNQKYQTETGQCPALRITFHKLFPHF